MERGGEAEAKVSLSDTLGHFFWGTLDLDPECFKDVGGSHLGRCGTIAVLTDWLARSGNHECGHCRNVHRTLVVTTGTHNVKSLNIKGDSSRVAQHGAHHSREFVGGFALGSKRNKNACNLCGVNVTIEDNVHHCFGLRRGQV
jgi:hypothetical protein